MAPVAAEMTPVGGEIPAYVTKDDARQAQRAESLVYGGQVPSYGMASSMQVSSRRVEVGIELTGVGSYRVRQTSSTTCDGIVWPSLSSAVRPRSVLSILVDSHSFGYIESRRLCQLLTSVSQVFIVPLHVKALVNPTPLPRLANDYLEANQCPLTTANVPVTSLTPELCSRDASENIHYWWGKQATELLRRPSSDNWPISLVQVVGGAASS